MEIDITTYNDLSVFHHEEENSIFHKLNFTETLEGKEWLMRFFKSPFSESRKITDVQDVVKAMLKNLDQWPSSITNGTLMVVARFYDTAIDSMPAQANFFNAANYKVFHTADFSLVRYSVSHFADFIRGMHQLVELLKNEDTPALLVPLLERIKSLTQERILLELAVRKKEKAFDWKETVYYGKYLKEKFKSAAFELMALYGRFDAWHSMAKACRHFKLSFPVFEESEHPMIDATQLYHILLPTPVPYDVHMSKDSNFLFLTGANMAGKSTFIKSVGASVFLAHLGMGVPASAMRLTTFDGLLSNINVVDNIVKGESYFYNEVQRIRNTIIKINDKRKWLVLIDELFKGTNVQDAMKCSSTVIKGLIKISNSLFILSTHLYEIGEELKTYPNISFRYFETSVHDDQLVFSYQLKEGISNDRLGYLILKREKVVELLENIGKKQTI